MNVTLFVRDVTTKLELTDRTVEQNTSAIEDLDEKLGEVYADLMEKITMLNKPTGNLTNPVTGEIEDADKVVSFVYYTLLHNHIPNVEDMGAWSPKVSEMENDKTPLKETSVNMRPWYEDPRSPITGKRTDPKALLSSLHRNPDQVPNEKLKDFTVADLKEDVKNYSDFKTTEALSKIGDVLESLNSQLTQLTTNISTLEEKVNGIDERLKVIESG